MPVAEAGTALEFEALGTHWYVDAEGGIPRTLSAAITAELERIDAVWSRFRGDSMVAELARDGGTRTLTPYDLGLLHWYARLYEATNGKVTPLVGRTLSDAGYDTTIGLRPRANIAETPPWDHRRHLTPTGIALDGPLLLDVGAAGKGYAADRVAALLERAGVHSYIVDAGGDIAVGAAEHVIGLEHPIWPDRAIGTAAVGGTPSARRAICGSATNRRAWADWHHILDPETSRPTTEVIATWAIADSAMHADGLATALFFVPPEALQTLVPFDYVVIHGDGSIVRSDTAELTIFEGDAP